MAMPSSLLFETAVAAIRMAATRIGLLSTLYVSPVR
jgi:hypothetical protein